MIQTANTLHRLAETGRQCCMMPLLTWSYCTMSAGSVASFGCTIQSFDQIVYANF